MQVKQLSQFQCKAVGEVVVVKVFRRDPHLKLCTFVSDNRASETNWSYNDCSSYAWPWFTETTKTYEA